jgi:hypothetical protein
MTIRVTKETDPSPSTGAALFAPPSNSEPIETAFTGVALLSQPRLNKGSAFSSDERTTFHLHGLLPPAVMTIEQQLDRTYQSFRAKTTDTGSHHTVVYRLAPWIAHVEQVKVASYRQRVVIAFLQVYDATPYDLERYIYLASLQDRNEVLYFRLLKRAHRRDEPDHLYACGWSGVPEFQPHLSAASWPVPLL